jgi:hypothetical protein
MSLSERDIAQTVRAELLRQTTGSFHLMVASTVEQSSLAQLRIVFRRPPLRREK